MMKDKLYEDISKRINQLFGIHLKKNSWASMEKNLVKAAKSLNRKEDLESISKWVLKTSLNDIEYHALATNLTVGETYFFREITGLTLLTNQIIPAIRKSNSKTLKIWSAGCSTGEEPYSIAIFLKENLPDIHKWDIQIIATDLNKDALNKARKGTYRPWSFRGLREDLLSKYFVIHANTYNISSDIREMIQFRHLNLVKDEYPLSSDRKNGFNVIFCRNVLMYFSQDTIQSITQKFYSALDADSWLITSQTELSINIFHSFGRKRFMDGFFFKKGGDQPEDMKDVFSIQTLKNAVRPKRNPGVTRSKSSLQTNRKVSPLNKQKPASPAVLMAEAPRIRELYENSEDEKCISIFEAANKPGTFAAEERFLIAKSYANMGIYTKGLAMMEELISSSPIPEYYYFYAAILIEQENWAEAEKNLVKALYLKPDYLSARLSLFLALKKLDKNEKAAKEGTNLLNDIKDYDRNELLPDMEGMTAGSLRQMIDLMHI